MRFSQRGDHGNQCNWVAQYLDWLHCDSSGSEWNMKYIMQDLERVCTTLEIERYQTVINQGGHPITLVTMVTTLWRKSHTGIIYKVMSTHLKALATQLVQNRSPQEACIGRFSRSLHIGHMYRSPWPSASWTLCPWPSGSSAEADRCSAIAAKDWLFSISNQNLKSYFFFGRRCLLLKKLKKGQQWPKEHSVWKLNRTRVPRRSNQQRFISCWTERTKHHKSKH